VEISFLDKPLRVVDLLLRATTCLGMYHSK